MKKDKELALIAIEADTKNIQYISSKLKNDKQFLTMALKVFNKDSRYELEGKEPKDI